MARGIPAEESWLPRALQSRLDGSASSHFLGDVAPDVRNWLCALRFTVDDYDERFLKKDDRAKEGTLQKGLSDSDLSTHSFDFIDLDHLNLNKHFADGERVTNDAKEDDVYANVFDDILCNLGNEIFQLDSYHKKHFREARDSDSSEFEHSVMHVFDDFLEEVRSSTPLLDDISVNGESRKEHGIMELKVPLINKVPSYSNISALSDEVFLRSGSTSRNASNSNINSAVKDTDDVVIRSVSRPEQCKHASFDINRIFDKGGGAPVPPKRKNRLSIPTLRERAEMINKQRPIPKERSEIPVKPVPKPRNISKVDQLRARFDSDTEITRGLCQKAVGAHPAQDGSDSGNNSPASDYSDYQNLWLCTSGRHRQVIGGAADSFKENFGVVNTIRYDSLKDISNPPPEVPRQRIVLCGPHTRVSPKSGSSSSNKSEGAEGGTRSLDDRRSREKPRGLVSCTSECDATDECHRAISRCGEASLDTPAKRDVITDRDSASFVRVYGESATVPRARELKTFGNIRGRDLPRSAAPYDCASDCADSGSMCGTDYLNTTATTEDDWESSVEIISDSSSSSRLGGRAARGRRTASDSTDYASESPIYENLREIVRLKPVPDDVIAWKALLMDPYWIEDEEDEWISSEESFKYSQDRLASAPAIIPRVRSCRSPPRPRQERPEDPPHSVRDATRMFEQSGLLQGGPGSPKGRYRGAFGTNDALPTRVLPPISGSREVELRPKDSQNRFLQEQRSKSMLTTPRRTEKHLAAPPKGQIFKEGLLEWTKFLEDGKKTKKSWQTNFAVLKRSTLEFYPKDTTHNSKQRPSPEYTAMFESSVVSEATSQQTKQNNAYVLTSKRDQIFFRHKDPKEADDWYLCLKNIINNQATEYQCPDSSSSTGSPSPSPKQKSRMPYKDVEKSDPQDSVNEPKENYIKRDLENIVDTGDPQDIQNAPMKKRIFTLQSLIKKRKSKEEITSKGIYKDEAVFGCSLKEVCNKDRSLVPEFVKRCIGVIEAKDENMNADGLYRASGNLSQVQKIRMEVDKNNFAILDKPDTDVHVLAGALKLFFRELKESVIPCELFERVLNATSTQDYNARVKEFKEIVKSLPECNRQTLKYLLEHLLRVAEREDKNRMQINNLSIVFGPTLLWPSFDTMNLISIGCLQQNLVIEIMLTEFKALFTNKNDYETPL